MVLIDYIGKCLLVDKGVLVVGDLHFGFGEAARESGFLVPGDAYSEIIKEFDEVFEKIGKRQIDRLEKDQLGVTVDSRNGRGKGVVGGEKNVDKWGGVEEVNRVMVGQVRGLMGDGLDGLDGKVVDKIVLLGDVKHVFGTILHEEWKHIGEFFDYLSKKCGEIVIVKGNHDVLLDKILSKGRKVGMAKCQENTSLDHTQSTSIAKGTLMKDQQGVTVDSEDGREDDRSGAKKVDGDKVWQIKTVDYYINAGVCYLHGNKNVVEASDCSVWVIGHGHPAVSIGDGVRKEKYKCFLVGEFEGRDVVIVPSFFPLVEGADVSKMKSGFDLKLAWDFDLGDFEVRVVDCLEVRGFGKLKDIEN